MELKVFDVLNTRQPNKYAFNTALKWAFKLGVHDYQKDMFPETKDRASLWTTHSRIYMGEGLWLSVTNPHTKWEKFDFDNYKAPYAILRYKHIDGFDALAIKAGIELGKELEGTEYDYLQIVGMLLHRLFPNLIPEDSKIIKAHGERVVCSVGALSCLVAAWKKSDRTLPRPGGDPTNPKNLGIHLEAFPPAGFHNHKTFDTIYTQKW